MRFAFGLENSYLKRTVLMTMVFSSNVFAAKSNQAVYEDPFDLASGGSSLTRSTREGMMFANPAQMPYGGKVHRWLGTSFSLMAAKESVTLAKEIAESGGGSKSEDEIIDAAFDNPIHFGFTSTLTYLTNYFGLEVFGRFEPDIRAQEFGQAGIPEIRVQAEGYGGAVSSFAMQTVRWFAVGITTKYLYVTEPDLSVAVSDQEKVQKYTNDPQSILDEVTPEQGLGFDLGLLFFAQGNYFDSRLAIKVDDIGDTQFGENQQPFKQTISTGVGFALHNNTDAIHVSADYRDLTNAYEEPMFKKVYLGTKIVLRTYIGLAAGVYNGYPTYGARLDLILLKFGATVYGREFSDSPGSDGRNIYVFYFITGF